MTPTDDTAAADLQRFMSGDSSTEKYIATSGQRVVSTGAEFKAALTSLWRETETEMKAEQSTPPQDSPSRRGET